MSSVSNWWNIGLENPTIDIKKPKWEKLTSPRTCAYFNRCLIKWRSKIVCWLAINNLKGGLPSRRNVLNEAKSMFRLFCQRIVPNLKWACKQKIDFNDSSKKQKKNPLIILQTPFKSLWLFCVEEKNHNFFYQTN